MKPTDEYGLGTDIYLDGDRGDLAVEDGDLKLVGGADCLLQNLTVALMCGYSGWGAELLSGSGLAAGVEADEEMFESVVRQKVREICRWDGRVDMDTVQVEFEYDENDGQYLRAVAEFETINGDSMSIILPPFDQEDE